MKEKIETVLQDLREGKQGAFDRFLDLVQKTIYSFGMRVCGEQEDAKDTLQITLLKAFQTLPNIEITDAKALKVWLYKVAKNSCLMMRRKRKSEPEQKLSLEERISSEGENKSGEIPDLSMIPIEVLLKKETMAIVQRAILRLPYPHRIVLVMRDLEQLSTNEVSEILGVSRDAVKIRLHRARSALKKELEKHFTAPNRKNISKSGMRISPDVKSKLQKYFQVRTAKRQNS